ncbi:MAG TPA: type II toxin-antitoxin system VapC family toxin [Acidobacteriota bacterium]|nr:type II toxin-antitoxin system VapC family toxin [Acidobacteriota bacterium]
MILLDTSGYSAYRRGHAAILETLKKSAQIYLNPVVLGELHQGFRRGRRRAKNETELERFLASGRVRLLDITADTAGHYASIVADLRAAGTPIPTNDIWIAASAMQFGLTVVTTDGHFNHVPQIKTQHFSLHS